VFIFNIIIHTGYH